jgi:NAD(P)-dependent dehydrogenase (short-subunit alcohol dehydrogenase family)
MTKVVLVTGASQGIGRATAERFAAAGWSVAATMRRPGEAPHGATSDRIRTVALDVTDQQSVADAIVQVISAFGQIDALVNNAGYGLVGPFEVIDEAQVRRQFETNVFGLMAVTRAVLPHMRARRSGVIVNVSSMGGRVAFPFYSVYHATKWAVGGFSESLAYELRPYGIAVKIIEPGAIKTEFYGRSEEQPAGIAESDYSDDFARIYRRMTRATRHAPGPELVAEAIFAAATDGSGRMRYLPNARAILAARAVLPDRLFRRGVRRLLGVRPV